ncbi:hypothetical protein [Nocardioides sp. Arc9.136]|uniref:hypothetical protein n=1 Tax=Nocardioides sp. Arc9.136 TaxID=2996826 RepID=UPI002665938E|nr:hypothetical protein [Nocardioides sp. Arc9.136]WKN50506.1 hypothetical protein OSR43_10345 [Nocardioides sp. Arc9.136]
MDDRRSASASATTARSRATWAAFGGASALVLGACLALALQRDNAASVAVVLLGGLVAVGIAALFLVTATPRLPGQSGRWRVPEASRRQVGGAGGAGGAVVGGGFAGGSDCGGGGGGGDCG